MELVEKEEGLPVFDTDILNTLVPWLRYSFSDISLSVCPFMCVYDVGCFVDVLASRSRYCGRKLSVPMIAILLSSSVGMSIE